MDEGASVMLADLDTASGTEAATTLDGDRATGEVYGIAHHLTPDRHGGTDYVMLMRYLDTYERRDGRWAIAERHALTDWTEVRTALRS